MVKKYRFTTEHVFNVAWKYMARQLLTCKLSHKDKIIEVSAGDMDKYDFADCCDFLSMLAQEDARGTA